MDSKTKILRYRDEEAHIVRRLGAAVVSLWHELPETEREKILKRSLMVIDAYQTVQLESQILIFIEEHAGER
jgi:hypothetical protein